jgi:uncharacterized membrane protein YhaH (DUF805 family)
MNQKKKKKPVALPPQEAPQESRRRRKLFWGIVLVLYSLGYALSVWANLRSGVSLNQAFIRSFTTMLFVILMQSPLWFWYKKRLKGTAAPRN